jgi:hypothetical protein
MRARAKPLLAALAVAATLAGCGDIAGLLGWRPPTIVERHGLSYQLFVSESPYYFDTYDYRIRVTNTSRHSIERWLPGQCAVRLRAYRDGDWGRPAWDSCRWGCSCLFDRGIWVRLRPGEAVEPWWGEVWSDLILERRLAPGRYHLAAVVRADGRDFEILGLPEMWLGH